jgi:TIGR03009 family protein
MMMRLTWATIVAAFMTYIPASAQQAGVPSNAQQGQQPAVIQNAAQAADARNQAQEAQRQAIAQELRTQPFPPLTAAELAALQSTLTQWEQQSKGTKTLECKFTRWHFDMFAAPAGVHADRSDGVVKYAAPDKGLFRVDEKVFFKGMDAGKPQFGVEPGQFGEHWVCNGQQLIEFDRTKEECRIQDLPPEMQGQNIISSPLPFVFNLDAARIQQRYWIRTLDSGKPGIVLIEAWPKLQEDRAQYKLVQIALDGSNFLPQALIMYAPNFDKKTAPKWDHYEFTGMKRNAIGAGISDFFNNFIPEKPPANWKILRDKFVPPVEPPVQQAAAPIQQPGQPERR